MKLLDLERVSQQVKNSELSFIYLSLYTYIIELSLRYTEMYAVDTGTLEVEASLVKTV